MCKNVHTLKSSIVRTVGSADKFPKEEVKKKKKKHQKV